MTKVRVTRGAVNRTWRNRVQMFRGDTKIVDLDPLRWSKVTIDPLTGHAVLVDRYDVSFVVMGENVRVVLIPA